MSDETETALTAALRLAERWDAVSARIADSLDPDQHVCGAVRGETACEVYGRHADDLLAALGPWLLPQVTNPPTTPPHDAEMAAARDADRVARVCCGGECCGCSHEWLDRPESDTYECLICGAEGQGTPPTPDRVARVAEGGGL